MARSKKIAAGKVASKVNVATPQRDTTLQDMIAHLMGASCGVSLETRQRVVQQLVRDATDMKLSASARSMASDSLAEWAKIDVAAAKVVLDGLAKAREDDEQRKRAAPEHGRMVPQADLHEGIAALLGPPAKEEPPEPDPVIGTAGWGKQAEEAS